MSAGSKRKRESEAEAPKVIPSWKEALRAIATWEGVLEFQKTHEDNPEAICKLIFKKLAPHIGEKDALDPHSAREKMVVLTHWLEFLQEHRAELNEILSSKVKSIVAFYRRKHTQPGDPAHKTITVTHNLYLGRSAFYEHSLDSLPSSLPSLASSQESQVSTPVCAPSSYEK